jgi:hypothetical protein
MPSRQRRGLREDRGGAPSVGARARLGGRPAPGGAPWARAGGGARPAPALASARHGCAQSAILRFHSAPRRAKRGPRPARPLLHPLPARQDAGLDARERPAGPSRPDRPHRAPRAAPGAARQGARPGGGAQRARRGAAPAAPAAGRARRAPPRLPIGGVAARIARWRGMHAAAAAAAARIARRRPHTPHRAAPPNPRPRPRRATTRCPTRCATRRWACSLTARWTPRPPRAASTTCARCGAAPRPAGADCFHRARGQQEGYGSGGSTQARGLTGAGAARTLPFLASLQYVTAPDGKRYILRVRAPRGAGRGARPAGPPRQQTARGGGGGAARGITSPTRNGSCPADPLPHETCLPSPKNDSPLPQRSTTTAASPTRWCLSTRCCSSWGSRR